MKPLSFVSIFLFATAPAFAERGDEAILARGGKALLPVVHHDKASAETVQVAKELVHYLDRITGAKFAIETHRGQPGIVVGTVAEFPQPDRADALAIKNRFDGVEAFVVRTNKDSLWLIGATDLGASHAVFRFLERIGCRWYFPAKEWEILPTNRDLTVSLNITDRPGLLSRRIWYGYGFFDRAQKRTIEEYEAWKRHNRMAASLKIHAGHAWQAIIIANKKTFEEHPEYLALVKGNRQGEQLCVSNPAVRKLAVEYALNKLRKEPTADMVSMETSDGYGQCECEHCKKLGSISDRAFGLANEVAKAVRKEFPGKMVGMLAYSQHSEPPSFPLEPNIYVQLTAGFIRGQYSFDELKELWPKFSKNLGFYEYFSVWPWDFDMPPGGRAANISLVHKRIQDYVAHSATSLDCESGNNWGPHGLGYYIANKLMWNPDTDAEGIEVLKSDFFQKAFGPAEKPMARYYGRFEKHEDVIVSEHLLALALRDLEEAGKLAKGRDDVQTRLDHLKQYQHYVRLKWDFDRVKDVDRKKTLALQALTHCYRTRYSYMNHWIAMQAGWSPKLAKEFNEPSWDGTKNQKAAPWKIDAPLSPEETDKLFRADLERFQPQDVTERTFSMDLVPSGLTSAKPVELAHRFQSPGRYAFYSPTGEPLEMTFVTGVIVGYRDRALATLTVTDAGGTKVHQERMELDGKDHAVKIKVPKAGLYWVEFNDSGAGWGIRTPAGNPASFVPDLKRRIGSLGQLPRLYFFVPKGTQHIDYFYEGNGHDLLSPDGKIALKVSERGKYIRVPVPTGMDGQAWSLQRMAFGKLWFANVPNVLAASPEGLLVPREVR